MNVVKVLREIFGQAFGERGFKVISNSQPVSGRFYALRAVNGNIILGNETQVAAGDSPVGNHEIVNGDFLHGNFSQIQRADTSDDGAVIYAYII